MPETKSRSSSRLYTHSGLVLVLSLGLVSLGACAGEDPAPEPIAPPTPASAARPPPPISGGTLLVSADNATIVAADPDRDRIILVDLASGSVVANLALETGDEPGRVVEGPPGTANVALRRGGEVVSIDLKTKSIARRTSVCAAPRGMAYQDGLLHVACAGGELVSFDAASGALKRNIKIADDLRDIVPDGESLLVSRFRSAEVLRVMADGQTVPVLNGFKGFGSSPFVAWRMVRSPSGSVAMVHQLGQDGTISTEPGGYSQSPCNSGIVNSAVSFLPQLDAQQLETGALINDGALPVDLAFSVDGSTFAVVAAGSQVVFSMPVAQYQAMSNVIECPEPAAPTIVEGEPIAVAFANYVPVVQTREPARILIGADAVVELGGESVKDAGHYLFHHAPRTGMSMACASCHPEGREDGRVWDLANVGPRRTQSIAGGLLATAPLHWDGELAGFDDLMSDVFTGRMGGDELSAPLKLAVARWIDSIPLLPKAAPADSAQVARGKVLFEDATIGCANCHGGTLLTNNLSYDVGTGGTFQVPSLRGVGSRAPYMHSGCADTLVGRFSVYCGGGDTHGMTSKLDGGQIMDLVAYLETL